MCSLQIKIKRRKEKTRVYARKIVFASALATMLLSLLSSQVSASISIAFAPYAWGTGSYPGGYIPYTFVGGGGRWTIGNAFAGINAFTGRNQEWAGPGFGLAVTWIWTGSWWYFGPNQPGRVHLNTFLEDSSIAGNAWVGVLLMVVERWPLQAWWRLIWWRWTPGAFAAVADGGICRVDLSYPGGLPFMWTGGKRYDAYGAIVSFGLGGTANVGYSRYDEIMWVADTSSPEEVQPYNGSAIVVNPPIGPVCNVTTITVNGTRFAPESKVYIYYDDALVTTTLSDGHGNFTTSFDKHETIKGVHTIKAIDALENMDAGSIIMHDLKHPTYADMNGDGKVNILDLVKVAGEFGYTYDPPGEGQSLSTTIILSSTATVATIVLASTYSLHKKKRR